MQCFTGGTGAINGDVIWYIRVRKVTKSQEGGTCRNGSRSIRVRKVNKSKEGEQESRR